MIFCSNDHSQGHLESFAVRFETDRRKRGGYGLWREVPALNEHPVDLADDLGMLLWTIPSGPQTCG